AGVVLARCRRGPQETRAPVSKEIDRQDAVSAKLRGEWNFYGRRESGARLVEPDPGPVVIEVNNVGAAIAIEIDGKDTIIAVAGRELRRVVHLNAAAPDAVSEIRPIADIASAYSNEILLAIASHVGKPYSPIFESDVRKPVEITYARDRFGLAPAF